MGEDKVREKALGIFMASSSGCVSLAGLGGGGSGWPEAWQRGALRAGTPHSQVSKAGSCSARLWAFQGLLEVFQQPFNLGESPPGSGIMSAVSYWEFGLARRQQSAVLL